MMLTERKHAHIGAATENAPVAMLVFTLGAESKFIRTKRSKVNRFPYTNTMYSDVLRKSLDRTK